MEFHAEAYQFLSRQNIANQLIGSAKTYPKDRADIVFLVDYEICDKPFELNFAEVIPKNPSIGPYEYIDPEVDLYMHQRWPKCIKAVAKINTNDQFELYNEIKVFILSFMRIVLWELRKHDEFVKKLIDQSARMLGYRRQYFSSQILDFDGNRIPNPSINYIPANVGDYTGPGIAFFPGRCDFNSIDQFVWSQIIPFPVQSGEEFDIPVIQKRASEIVKHYNAYNELSDAKRHLSSNEIKACMRSAAASIDAILHYYCKISGISFPNKKLQFDEKIESILKSANMPSYKEVDPDNLTKLLYLYRARNSMHEVIVIIKI